LDPIWEKKLKNVPSAGDHWINNIIQWNNGASKDFCVAGVTLEKFLSSILEPMKE